MLTVIRSNEVEFVDSVTRTVVHSFPLDRGRLFRAAESVLGKIAIVFLNGVYVYDVDGTNSDRVLLPGVGSVAFSPNGELLACALGYGVRVYDSQTLKLVWSKSYDEGYPDDCVCDIVFSPDSERLFVFFEIDRVTEYSAKNGNVVIDVTGFGYCGSFSGSVFVVDSNNAVTLSSADDPYTPIESFPMKGIGSSILMSDGVTLVSNRDSILTVLNTITHERVVLDVHISEPIEVAGRLVYLDAPGRVHSMDPITLESELLVEAQVLALCSRRQDVILM
jgi:WD40 repeat protein